MLGAGVTGSLSARAAVDPPVTTGKHLFNVRDFGASGRKEDKATTAVRNAVEACANAGGGMVYVPPGDYTVGSIEFKDNINLHLEAGATFFLSQDQEDFISGVRSMLYADKVQNISLTGSGVLDGLAQYEFVDMRGLDIEIAEEIEIARSAGIDMRRYYRIGMQTFMFDLVGCTNVKISDISIINSPLWSIRMTDCERVFVRGVYIYSDLEKGVNADGIDVCSSRNVTISDSVITTADDAIVLKTRKTRDQTSEDVKKTENVVVTNCVLSSSSTPLMIGTETHADIKHVIFSNCTIRNSNKGFGINVQDGATVSDIIISNLTIETSRRHWNWWGSCEMVKFVLKKREDSSRVGKIRDVLIENVICHARGTSTVKGMTEQPLENIRMNNVQLYMEHEDAKDKRAGNAMEFEHISGLKLQDLTVNWSEGTAEEKWKSALQIRESEDFEIRNFRGRQGLKGSASPAILLENVSDALIADSKAEAGCADFIQLTGDRSSGITLRYNDTTGAQNDISFGQEKLKSAVNKI